MAGSEILKSLFDEKKIRLLQELISSKEELTLQEISTKSKVAIATAYRQMKEFVELGLVRKKKLKHLTLYSMAASDESEFLKNLLYERPQPIKTFMEMIKDLPNIQTVMLHGEASESKASVVILGENIDRESVNQAVARMREDLNFTISHLILDQEQFVMLEQMGQFSGQRTILLGK